VTYKLLRTALGLELLITKPQTWKRIELKWILELRWRPSYLLTNMNSLDSRRRGLLAGKRQQQEQGHKRMQMGLSQTAEPFKVRPTRLSNHGTV